MSERELLLYLQGFIKGIGFDESQLTHDILLNWDEMIDDVIYGDKDANKKLG